MRLAFSVVFLVLSSCGSTDYFETAVQCDIDHKVPLVNAAGVVEVKDGLAVMVIEKGFCDEEWAKYEKAEERKDRRAEFERLTACPSGQVFICRDRWCSQGWRRYNRKPSAANRVKSRCGVLDVRY